MIPLYLKIENFMILSEVEIDFSQFSSAIILAKIAGNSQRSNGAGKSTISHAINCVLFDIWPVSPIEKAIRDGQDGYKITFIFKSSDNQEWKIVRSRRRKSKQAEVLLEKKENDKWTDKTQKTNSETDAEIRKILGFNYEIRRNTTFFAQSDLSGLINSKNTSTRKTIFENIFQLDIYQALEKSIYENEIKQFEKNILQIERDILNLKNPEEQINILLQESDDCELKIKENSNKFAEFISLLGMKSISLENLERILSSDLLLAISEKEKKSKDIFEISNKISNLNKLLTEKEKNKIYFTQSQASKELEIISLQKNKEEENQKCWRDEKIIEEELLKTSQKEEKGRNLIARLEAELRQKEKQILPEKESCEECFQSISSEYRQAHSEKNLLEQKQIQEKLQNYRQILSAVVAKKVNLEKEYKGSFESRNKINILENKIISAQKEFNLLKTNEDQNQQLIQHFISEISLLEEKNKIEQKNLDLLNDKISKWDVIKIKKEIEIIKKEIKNLQENNEKNNSETLSLEKQLAVIKNNIEKANLELEKKKNLEIEIGKLKQDLEICQLIKSSFASEGIPHFIISTNLKPLERKVNQWLQKLKPEFAITINQETFEISFRLQNKIRDYDQISFGQRFILIVAIKLGLRDLLKEKFGFDCQLLEFDEVDQSFDEASTQAYLFLLKELQKSFKILVVAHNDNLKEKFSHAIMLESNGIDRTSGQVVEH